MGLVFMEIWQHLNIPGDLRIHLTREVPKNRLYLFDAPPQLSGWRTLVAAISPTGADSKALLFPDQPTKYGPGVVVIAPDLPSARLDWRFVVELLAGTDGDGGYPTPPFPDAVPIPMQDGNVVLRDRVSVLLPASRPTDALFAFRGWWLPESAEDAGIVAFL
jgi:hypothetical protein